MKSAVPFLTAVALVLFTSSARAADDGDASQAVEVKSAAAEAKAFAAEARAAAAEARSSAAQAESAAKRATGSAGAPSGEPLEAPWEGIRYEQPSQMPAEVSCQVGSRCDLLRAAWSAG